jgi:hypothetical protein
VYRLSGDHPRRTSLRGLLQIPLCLDVAGGFGQAPSYAGLAALAHLPTTPNRAGLQQRRGSGDTIWDRPRARWAFRAVRSALRLNVVAALQCCCDGTHAWGAEALAPPCGAGVFRTISRPASLGCCTSACMLMARADENGARGPALLRVPAKRKWDATLGLVGRLYLRVVPSDLLSFFSAPRRQLTPSAPLRVSCRFDPACSQRLT